MGLLCPLEGCDLFAFWKQLCSSTMVRTHLGLRLVVPTPNIATITHRQFPSSWAWGWNKESRVCVDYLKSVLWYAISQTCRCFYLKPLRVHSPTTVIIPSPWLHSFLLLLMVEMISSSPWQSFWIHERTKARERLQARVLFQSPVAFVMYFEIIEDSFFPRI